MKIRDVFPFVKGKPNGIDDGQNSGKGGIYLPADRRIGSCMTHRPDIVWIDAAMERDAIRAIMDAHHDFTQFPVCSGSVDKVLGVLTVRNFLETLLQPGWTGLRDIVKKAVFLPETVTILKALQALDGAQCRLAFIIDEYGGVEGIVTRNGLVRELLEETRDEGIDRDGESEAREDGGRFLDGQTRMEEVLESYRLPGLEEDRGEYYTLAGFLLSVNGTIPKKGDVIETGGYRWEVVEMDGNRIDRVLVTPAEGKNDSGS